MRRIFPFALLAAVLVALPQQATAQIRVHAGAGLANPTGDFGDAVDSGFQGRVGLTLGAPLFPLSLRAEGEYSRFPAAGTSDGNASVLGGNLSVVLGLGGIGISPYVLAGLGRYRVDFSDEFGAFDATTDPGWHAGFGVDLGLLGFGGFVEARFVNVDGDGGDTRMFPVTLGIRF